MLRAWRSYEMGRFDLVRGLNRLEASKKVHLTESACAALYAMLGASHGRWRTGSGRPPLLPASPSRASVWPRSVLPPVL